MYVSFFLLIIILILGAGALRFSPYVQTKVVHELSIYASKKLGYPIKIQTANLKWLDTIKLGGVEINDPQGKEMIKIGELTVNFNLTSLQDSTNLNLDFVRLTNPDIHLTIDEQTNKLNIDEFILKINQVLAPKNPKKRVGRGQIFTIDNAEIIKGIVSYQNNTSAKRKEKNRFDENHFILDNLNGKISNFFTIRDSVTLGIDIKAVDRKTGLEIKRLAADFFISDRYMVFDDLTAKFGNSIIKNYLKFEYKSQKDLSDFYTKVKIKANLDSTYITSKDLAYFIPDVRQYNDNWYINTNLEGRIIDLNLKNSRIYFGKSSKIYGDLAFKGLPNLDKTFMNFNLKNTFIKVKDLENYIGKATVNTIEKFDFVNYDGAFKGTVRAFNTVASIKTAMGNVDTDLSMDINKDGALTTYAGTVKLVDFKVGEFLGDEKNLQKIRLDGKIKGIGLSPKDAVLDVDGRIENITYNGYDYKNLYINGNLQKGLFEGNTSVKDSNLIFNLKGIVDLREGRENFNLKGNLIRANLKTLKLTDQAISVSTDLNVSFSGLKIDDIIGFGRFQNFKLIVDKRQLAMDTLFVYSAKENKNRDIILESDLLRLKLSGNYVPTVASTDLQQLLLEYKDYFFNNQFVRDQYYKNKVIDITKNYSIDYSIDLIKTKPLLNFIYPEAHISNLTPIQGTFTMGNNAMLTMSGRVDTISVKNNTFYNTDFDINTSKFVNSPEVLASGIINSEKQKISALAPTEKLAFESAWDKDRIIFTSSLKQQESTNKANLNGNLLFTPYGFDVQFKRSKIKLLNEDWLINSENLINVTRQEVAFKDMTIENKNQIIAINGSISTDSLETLRVKATNFELATISPVLDLAIAGTVNGEATIKDITKNAAIEGLIKIDSLVYKKLWIGNLNGTSQWDVSEKLLNLHYFVERAGKQMLSLEGIYIPDSKSNSFDIIANLNQTKLTILEPFTEGLFSGIDGNANGQLHITGSPNDPIIEGEVQVNKGKVIVDYLKAGFNFENKISFTENKITAEKLYLTDSEGHKGTLAGGVEYQKGFKNMKLNLTGILNNFKILNTSVKDNELFYGQAYATGTLSVTGPLNDILIKAKATTNKGTSIYIPMDGAKSVTKHDYIEYITTNDSNQVAKIEIDKKTLPTNLSMDFNFLVTPEAYCEIQLDRQSGDMIKAFGNADLRMKVNTKGDFTIDGIYELEKGDYSFNVQTFTKNFKIRPKSKIIWTGDPLEAELNIKADYTQTTILDPILTSNLKDDSPKRYPVSVVIGLTERMLGPKVTYDIDFKDFPPNLRTDIEIFKNKIATNEQELTRQVGSLLITKSLLKENDQLSGVLLNNIGEFLLSKIGADANSKFQYGLNTGNFTGFNQSFFDALQVQASYNFDDRFRISRSSAISNTNTQNRSDYGYLIGDWTLEWLITKDGRLRAKGYNRNTPNTSFQGTGLNNSAINAYGASILYTKSFNYLFKKKPTPKILPNFVSKDSLRGIVSN